MLTGTRYTVCRCSRYRIVGAQRDSMGRPGRRLSWSCAPRSARPQAVAFHLRPQFSRTVGHICLQIEKQRGVLSELNSVWLPTQMCRK